MIKATFASAIVILSAATIIGASAQEAPTAEQLAKSATETRQAVFKLLGYNMGTISGMARGTVELDAQIAEPNARRIASLAPMIPELLAARDTRAFDVETEVLPIIWDQMTEFTEKADNLLTAANTFADIAQGGDKNAILGGLRAFGSTCGNCHDTLRVD